MSASTLIRQLRSKLRLEFAVDKHEGNRARRVRAIAPGMRRTALHGDIACLEQHILVIEHHGDLAFEDDRVIDRLGAMHQRVAPTFAPKCCSLVTERSEGTARIL